MVCLQELVAHWAQSDLVLVLRFQESDLESGQQCQASAQRSVQEVVLWVV
jgi:hypothetical protein